MKEPLALAYDLGTGGLKASIFDPQGNSVASEFVYYPTSYPSPGWHQQRPEDWWEAIVKATRSLLSKSSIDPRGISAIGISGHSLGAIPIDADGKLLLDSVPIWSDMRAKSQADAFFKRVDYEKWYMESGCGFPPQCYTIFKLMWLKECEPDVYNRCFKILGTKDYCNYKLSGKVCSDYSYASGWGVFNLRKWDYNYDFIDAAGLRRDIFPELVDSYSVIGSVGAEAASALGLQEGVKVVCGGVDNSCMALGAGCSGTGGAPQVYMSLGSSAWIAAVSERPVLNFKQKPYVFCHVNRGFYTSATCIFSAGTSLRWVRDMLCNDLVESEKEGILNAYAAMDNLASEAAAGSGGIIFNPSLAGGSMIEESPNLRGAFLGLSLSSSRAELIRAVLEGVALNLRFAFDVLSECVGVPKEMPVVGGGAKSRLWLEIFADIFSCKICKTSVDQDAASLGAAALAFMGMGQWSDFSRVREAQRIIFEKNPDAEKRELYGAVYKDFIRASALIARFEQSRAMGEIKS